jgi:proline dehydrogenase
MAPRILRVAEFKQVAKEGWKLTENYLRTLNNILNSKKWTEEDIRRMIGLSSTLEALLKELQSLLEAGWKPLTSQSKKKVEEVTPR